MLQEVLHIATTEPGIPTDYQCP